MKRLNLLIIMALLCICTGFETVSAAEIPQIKNLIFEENFSGNKAVMPWTFTQDNGSIGIIGEKLVLSRTTASSGEGDETIADLYLSSNKLNYQGYYALEFDVSRAESKKLYFRIRGKSGDFLAADWNEDGTFAYRTRETENGGLVNGSVNCAKYGNSVKIIMLFDCENNMFSVWMNGDRIIKSGYARVLGTGLTYMRTYLQSDALTTVTYDNIKFYEAQYLSDYIVNNDYGWLSADMLPVSEPFGGIVRSGFNLPVKGKYGSDISWESSDTSAVTSDGKNLITGNETKNVTLTAAISSNGEFLEKSFKFTVGREFTETEKCSADAQCLTYDLLMPHENGAEKIKRSLNLPIEGPYGSQILWQSSNVNYITNGGRVVRPKTGEQDARVNLSAVIKNGSLSLNKTFEFVVEADEEFTDPDYMTDEELFGVYENGTEVSKGKINYAYSEKLAAVEAAAKQGDYIAAKEELFNYFKNRTPVSGISQNRNTGWVNMILDDFYHLQGSEYYNGDFTVANEWETVYAEVPVSTVAAKSTVSYSLRSWYNESSYASIASVYNSNSQLRPKIELTVNGKTKIINAQDSIEIRAGKYKSTPMGGQEYINVQTFGDFLSDDTSYGIFKYNFSDISETDNVTSARLVLYAKAYTADSGKRMIIIKEPTNTWSAASVWNNFTGYVYSYNGLPGKNDWLNRPSGSDTEYWYQMCRYGAWGNVASEYKYGKDENVAYKAIRIVEDYLTDTGNYKMSGTTKYDVNGIRGGFTRSLDATGKNEALSKTFEVFLQSKYATPDYCSALLKNIWDTAHFLYTYHSGSGNWRQHEYQSLLSTTIYFPEFYDCFSGENWRKTAADELESILFKNNFTDGSYIEATCGYNVGAFSNFVSHKNTMEGLGVPVSKEYDEMLHKSAYYNALLYYPDGTSLQYGDDSVSKRSVNTFSPIVNWYGDEEFNYIINYGEKGKKPDWTSAQWPKSAVTVMRSDWSRDALFMFTNVRGGGQHGHSDDNGLLAYAYGRRLLCDSGIFTYTSSDPYRQWALSSEAHNTVVINEKSQSRDGSVGEIHEFTTNEAFDVLSQSTKQTSGFNHKRTVTFLKPRMWIVTDFMTPDDLSSLNTYKQIWHMLPDAELKAENGVISSNYETGANIIVASADKDAETHEADGWYDRSYQQLEEAKYGYFEKSGVGEVTFDTVLLPTNNDSGASASAEKLTTNGDGHALKINMTLGGEKYNAYYYISPSASGGSFGKYETDGAAAFVMENENGVITDIMMHGGTYIKETDGNANICITDRKNDIYAEYKNGYVYITSETNQFSVPAQGAADVYLNNEMVDYTVSDGMIENVKVNRIKSAVAAVDLPKTVYSDFALPLYTEGYEDITFTWSSNKNEITVDGGKAKVTRYSLKNTIVTLTLEATDGILSEQFEFDVEIPADISPICQNTSDLKFSESFDGKTVSTINGKLEQNGTMAAGNVDVSDGSLILKRDKTDSTHDGYYYYFNKDKSGIAGDSIALSFDMERENAGEVYIRAHGSGNAPAANIGVNIGGSERISAWNSSSTQQNISENYNKTDKVHMVIVLNFKTKQYDVWIDGEQLGKGLGFRSSGVNNLECLYVYIQNTYVNKVRLDNIQVYIPTEPNAFTTGRFEYETYSDKVTASASIYTNGENKEVILLLAAYKNGMLIKTAMQPFTVTKVKTTAEITLNVNTENTDFKAFIFENLNNIKPIN